MSNFVLMALKEVKAYFESEGADYQQNRSYVWNLVIQAIKLMENNYMSQHQTIVAVHITTIDKSEADDNLESYCFSFNTPEQADGFIKDIKKMYANEQSATVEIEVAQKL
jgi:hypothetical protein